MPISLNHMKSIKSAEGLKYSADILMDKAHDLIEPIFKEIIESGDINIMKEYLYALPSAFFRAELRGYIMQLENKS